MTRRARLAALVLAGALALPGVVARADFLPEPGQRLSVGGGRHSVAAPAGWVAQRTRLRATFSRDGFALNTLELRLYEPRAGEKSLARRTRAGKAWIEEFAGSYLARRTAEKTTQDVEVALLAETTLSGRPAFRLELEYTHAGWLAPLRLREFAVGTWTTDGLVVFRYAAPRLHYFEQAAGEFEAALAGVRVGPAGR